MADKSKNYSDLSKDELRAELEERGIDAGGMSGNDMRNALRQNDRATASGEA